MNNVNYITPQDVVAFCRKSLDPVAINQMFQENRGRDLSDPLLGTNLQAGKYIDVLVSLWCERDRQRRLEWLRAKSPELHPVLMFEQAIAEFTDEPTIETINLISIPLMNSAGFRVDQDSRCAQDISVKEGDAAQYMYTTYVERLDRRVRAVLTRSIVSIYEENPEWREEAIKAKVLATVQASLTRTLPSPNWVGWHGTSVFITGAPDMRPADQHKLIRDEFALKLISRAANPPATDSL
jgi:hypothetical protein